MIKKIGLLTSGGDSPGMNSAINNIVINGNKNNIKVYGIFNGYKGIFNNEIKLLSIKNIENINNKGGTFLKCSRFPELKNYDVRKQIIKNLKKKKIELLIIIGGDGSYKGAKKLSKMNFPCITLPGTIDNDIYGTDYTIGYYTALETITKSIENIKDTSISHNRISIVEIMGRNYGDLAISAYIACKCNFIIIPEILFDKKILLKKIKYEIKKNNLSYMIIIITENICNVNKLALYIEKYTLKETRATSLGYTQRGGTPVSLDKILAYRMSNYVIKMIKKNIINKCIGIKKEKIFHYNFSENFKKKKNDLNKKWLNKLKNKIKNFSL